MKQYITGADEMNLPAVRLSSSKAILEAAIVLETPRNKAQLWCLTFKRAVFSSVWGRRLCFCCSSGIRSVAFRAVVTVRYCFSFVVCLFLFVVFTIAWLEIVIRLIVPKNYVLLATTQIFCWMEVNLNNQNATCDLWSHVLYLDEPLQYAHIYTNPLIDTKRWQYKLDPLDRTWVMNMVCLLVFFIQSSEIFVAWTQQQKNPFFVACDEKWKKHDNRSLSVVYFTSCCFFTRRISLVSSESRLRPCGQTLLSARQLTLRRLPAPPGGELPWPLCGQKEAFSSSCPVH